MKPNRWQSLIGLLLVALLLAACGGQAVEPVAVAPTTIPAVETAPPPTPTLPPPTATPIPPTTTPEPPTATPEPATGLSDEALAAKIDEYLTNSADKNYFSGAALVARGDDIIISEGYGLADREQEITITPETAFYIASSTKPFTAMAIMMLQEQGKLDLNDPICDYLDECPAAWQPIMIRQLLNHTAGFDYEIDMSRLDIDPDGTDLVPLAEVVNLMADQSLLFAPGNSWSYSNNGYLLLGAIIERVSGQTYASFMEDNIFGPLGMDHTGFNAERDDLAQGYENRYSNPYDHVGARVYYPAAGIQSTVGDLFTFARAVADNRLVSEETLAQMIDPLPDTTFLEGEHYGYGWFIGELEGHPFFEHPGFYFGYVTRMMIFPDDDVTTIVLSNRESDPVWEYAGILAKWALERE